MLKSPKLVLLEGLLLEPCSAHEPGLGRTVTVTLIITMLVDEEEYLSQDLSESGGFTEDLLTLTRTTTVDRAGQPWFPRGTKSPACVSENAPVPIGCASSPIRCIESCQPKCRSTHLFAECFGVGDPPLRPNFLHFDSARVLLRSCGGQLHDHPAPKSLRRSPHIINAPTCRKTLVKCDAMGHGVLRPRRKNSTPLQHQHRSLFIDVAR